MIPDRILYSVGVGGVTAFFAVLEGRSIYHRYLALPPLDARLAIAWAAGVFVVAGALLGFSLFATKWLDEVWVMTPVVLWMAGSFGALLVTTRMRGGRLFIDLGLSPPMFIGLQAYVMAGFAIFLIWTSVALWRSNDDDEDEGAATENGIVRPKRTHRRKTRR